MAQNITLLGASYPAVPAVLLPKTGGGTARFDDTSDADATAPDILAGKTAYVNGVKVTGTGSGGGGGGSSWTKVAEKSYQISTTSTSNATVEELDTGHPEIWTNDKIIYVCVRDTVAARTGYFYGSDTFFLKTNYFTSTSHTNCVRFCKYLESNGTNRAVMQTTASGYGVWADTIYSDGRVRIRRRYSSSYGTINSTYKVGVYILDSADGLPPFVNGT